MAKALGTTSGALLTTGEPAEHVAPAWPCAGSTPSIRAGKNHRFWRNGLAAGLSAVVVLTTIGVDATMGGAALAQAEDPQVMVIQGVVERALRQHAQAVVNGDPSLMSDTATASYYRQLVQVGKTLSADGARAGRAWIAPLSTINRRAAS